MIQISTSDLKDYFRRAAGIKHAGIMPILDYIKIDATGDQAVITETNGSSQWLRHTVKAESKKDMVLLVHKETLKAVVSKSTDPAIQIKPKDKKIEISDLSFRLSCPTEEVDLFPQFPKRDESKKVLLSEALMEALSVAKYYTSQDSKVSGLDASEVAHVHPAKGGSKVFATDKHCLYSNFIKGDQAEFMLDKTSCDILTGYKECHFDMAGNQYFFDAGTTLLGFTKYDYKRFDYSHFVAGYQTEVYFKIQRSKIIAFCERIEALPLKAVYNEIELRDAGENKVALIFVNSEFENDGDEDIEVEKQGVIPNLFFNAKLMLKVLSPLPYDRITMMPFNVRANQYIIKADDDENFLAMIMGLNKM